MIIYVLAMDIIEKGQNKITQWFVVFSLMFYVNSSMLSSKPNSRSITGSCSFCKSGIYIIINLNKGRKFNN